MAKVEYRTGNILDDDADAVVIPVNTAGVMGGLDWQDVKPLLLQFAFLLPDTFTVRLYAPQQEK